MNNPGAIEKSESEFANHRGDLVPLVADTKTLVRVLIAKLPKRLDRMFTRRHMEDRVMSDRTFYMNDRRLDTLTNFVTVPSGLVMIFAPLWWLNFVVASTIRLAITTGFVPLFTILLSSATLASPLEVFVATAG